MKNHKTLGVDNLTRQTKIIDRGRVADTFWTRFKGLMGVQQLAPGDGLLITASNNIHTHFMAIPLDLFYVNTAQVVVGLDIALKPWRIGWPRRGAYYVIETPVGTIAHTGSRVGDQLKLWIETTMATQRSAN